jgi:hypothetical protein
MGANGFLKFIEIAASASAGALATLTALIGFKYRKDIAIAEKHKAAIRRQRIDRQRKLNSDSAPEPEPERHEPAHVG